MRRIRVPLLSLVAVASLMGGVAVAQTSAYTPTVGQRGKDVIWVPTPQALVTRMLDLAQATPDDRLVDLGSGDGRTVIAAAKRGIPAIGVEYNPDMVATARATAAREGVGHLAQFVQADLFTYDLSRATVVTLFLLPQLNMKLRPALLALRPGTRVVSNTFDMGDWMPDARADAGPGCTQYCHAMLWIVPARVAGSWSVPGGRLTLVQRRQFFTGRLSMDGAVFPVVRGKVRGDAIAFEAGGRLYTGRVRGNVITGSIQGSRETWSATRE